MWGDSVLACGLGFTSASYALRVGIINTAYEDLTFAVSTSTAYYQTASSLLALLKTTIETHSSIPADAITISLVNRRVRIVANALDINLDWAGSTLDPTLFGFVAETNVSGSTITAPKAPKGLWHPERPVSVDAYEYPQLVGGVAKTLSQKVRVSHLIDPTTAPRERDCIWRNVDDSRIRSENADSDAPYDYWEWVWYHSICGGTAFRLYDSESDYASDDYREYKIVRLDQPHRRASRAPKRYDVELRVVRTDGDSSGAFWSGGSGSGALDIEAIRAEIAPPDSGGSIIFSLPVAPVSSFGSPYSFTGAPACIGSYVLHRRVTVGSFTGMLSSTGSRGFIFGLYAYPNGAFWDSAAPDIPLVREFSIAAFTDSNVLRTATFDPVILAAGNYWLLASIDTYFGGTHSIHGHVVPSTTGDTGAPYVGAAVRSAGLPETHFQRDWSGTVPSSIDPRAGLGNWIGTVVVPGGRWGLV